MKYKCIIYIIIAILLTFFSACRNKSCRNNSRRQSRSQTEISETRRDFSKSTRNNKNSVIKMRKSGGVYYVPCKINGTEMEFIFDTGASDITISLTEAMFLYKQKKLTDSDFIGKQEYQIADGSIHEGMIVVLKEVIIGDWTLNNVKASIVDNLDAPLLLGQSALTSFGKIAIDYNKNEITFVKIAFISQN